MRGALRVKIIKTPKTTEALQMEITSRLHKNVTERKTRQETPAREATSRLIEIILISQEEALFCYLLETHQRL